LLNRAMNQAADELGAVFALHGAAINKNLTTIQLDIQAISSIEKYNRMQTYLLDLYTVKSVNALHIEGNNAVFEVVLAGDVGDFLNTVKNPIKIC